MSPDVPTNCWLFALFDIPQRALLDEEFKKKAYTSPSYEGFKLILLREIVDTAIKEREIAPEQETEK